MIVEVKIPKCLLIFTLEEFQGLMDKDRVLWARAVKRGKAARRELAYEVRMAIGEGGGKTL
jgi:hypothetical protein